MQPDINRLLDRAKIGIMQKKNSVFISTILFNLKFAWDTAIPTACTNGVYLKFNPDFFLQMNEEERMGVLVHEAWHVAFSHMLRVGDRDFNYWNQATDHVINLMLLANGYSLPDGHLADRDFIGKNSDEVYSRIYTEPDKRDKNFKPDMAPADDPNSNLTPQEIEKIEQTVTDTIIKASMAAKSSDDDPGSIPGEIEVELHKLLYPKLPWNVILSRFMTGLAPNDYSYRKVNKRFMPDFYLPSLCGEAIGNIAVAVDTSCSVSDEQFTEFLTEINEIKETLKPEKLSVIDFDTRIHAVHELSEYDSVQQVKFTGRGGTHIGEVLQWADQNKPLAMIIFTDGEFRTVDLDPKIPVIWIIHSNCYQNFKYDFGKIIEYPH